MAEHKESPDTDNLDDISLSENELDNIIDSAELSEVDLDTRSDDLSLDNIEDISLDGVDTPESADAPELPSFDDADDTGSDMSGGDISDLAESLDEIDDLPSLDEGVSETIDGTDLSTDNGTLDIPAVADAAPDELTADGAASALDDTEDEIIALSENEMDSILDDVDESQVLELNDENIGAEEALDSAGGSPAETQDFNADDESVTLSVDELDNIAQDIEESSEIEIPAADGGDLTDAAAAAASDSVELNIPGVSSDESSLKTSQDFEAEILQDANVSMKKVSEAIEAETEPAPEPEAEAAPAAPEAAAPKTPAPPPPAAEVTAGEVKDAELKELFVYLDKLLDSLPDKKIQEFAQSKYYDKYISIINRLGL